MRLTRRDFFGIAGGAGLVAATASLGLLKLGPSPSTGALLRSAVPLPVPFARSLTLPTTAVPDSMTTATAVGEQYTLVQRAAQTEIIPGLPTTVWGYNGTFPGPTIRARTGRPISVLVRNDLQVGTVVHLHGGRTPPESDGYPTDLILPRSGSIAAGMPMAGATTVGERTYAYPLEQRAATLWYHDHAMDFTGPHVYRGLAGFFLNSDAEDDALPLPRGDRDLPLMICDRAFAADGSFAYPALSPDEEAPGVEAAFMAGVLGDVILVNGVAWPRHEVSANRYRLRLLNASNARRYELVLDPPPPAGPGFVQIGTDGGLLATAVARDSVTLASGERVDAVVDFGAYPVGTEVTLTNRLGAGSTVPVMRFDVVRAGVDQTPDPLGLQRLSSGELLRESDAVRTRTFAFQLTRGSGDTGSGHAGHPAAADLDAGEGALVWTVNGQPFRSDGGPESNVAEPSLGDVEIWRLMTDLHHPVHLHLVHFQVLRRGGNPPGPADLGWKDTIDLLPGQTAEIITRFTGYRGRYVLHCHNLEHEDMAMMANFTVR